MIKEIKHNKALLAFVISHQSHKEGTSFLTSPECSQQVAYMQYPAGKSYQAHMHLPQERKISDTKETIFIRKGKLRVDFYTDEKKYLESYVLEAGDVVFLMSGGHGFEVLEDIEMIEVKQGPYDSEADKVRFDSIAAAEVLLKTP